LEKILCVLESWEPSRVWCGGDNFKRIKFTERERERRKRTNKRVGESEESCENWPERRKLAVLE